MTREGIYAGLPVGEGPTPLHPVRWIQSPEVCCYMTCIFDATATILVGAVRLPACFQHEREYVDRYGPADVHPLGVS